MSEILADKGIEITRDVNEAILNRIAYALNQIGINGEEADERYSCVVYNLSISLSAINGEKVQCLR